MRFLTDTFCKQSPHTDPVTNKQASQSVGEIQGADDLNGWLDR